MTAQFKTDQASVSQALTALLAKLEGVALADIEAINDATWHTAAEFDVDQTALEDALAASGWRGVAADTAPVAEKLADAMTPGVQIDFDPTEADQAGAFQEDALSVADAEAATDDVAGLEA